jgi:peroxin-11B
MHFTCCVIMLAWYVQLTPRGCFHERDTRCRQKIVMAIRSEVQPTNNPQLDATSIRKSSFAPRLLREGYRAWFAGISFSIASGLYSYYNLLQRSKTITSSSDPEKVVETKKLQKELDAVKVQLISDICDITIPSSALGWVDLDDGIVGLAGTTSSVLGVWSQWRKTA